MGNLDVNKFRDLYNNAPEYESVRVNEKMNYGTHILCLSGSHAYGTSRPDSDVDIRAVVGLDKKHILDVNKDWGVLTFSETDTEIYSYKKFLNLISDGNPSILCLLGQEEDDYLYLSDIGKELVNNYFGLFTGKRVYDSFVGYSNSQLRRLELAELGRLDEYGNVISQKVIKDKKISILDNAVFNLETKYPTVKNENLDIEFDILNDNELLIKYFHAENISMVDMFECVKDLKNISNSFGSKGKRNKKKSLFKLNKHCMHLIRGLLMGTELLETGIIKTYRKEDLNILLSILHGDFMNENGTMNSSFYDLLTESRKKADYAYKNTVLPSEIDMEKMIYFSEKFMLDSLKLNQ